MFSNEWYLFGFLTDSFVNHYDLGTHMSHIDANLLLYMMMSSNGNIFRITGHLCGEFTGYRWIPRTKGKWRGAWMFSLIYARINGWVNTGESGDLRCHHAHYNVIVMKHRVFYVNRSQEIFIWLALCYLSRSVLVGLPIPFRHWAIIPLNTVDILSSHIICWIFTNINYLKE